MRRSLVALVGVALLVGAPHTASADTGAPHITSVIAANTQLTVRWSPGANTDAAYIVQSSCDDGVTWNSEPTLDAKSDVWTFATTRQATACLVRVGAVQKSGDITYSEIAQPTPIAVTAPAAVTVTTDGSTSTVTWTSSHNAERFIVYASHDEGATWVQVAAADATRTSVTLQDLPIGTPIRVAAVDANGTIALSDTQRGLSAAAASAVRDTDDEDAALGSRSTLQIALTSLIALGAMFSLGMLIGRRSRRDDFTDFPSDVLQESDSTR